MMGEYTKYPNDYCPVCEAYDLLGYEYDVLILWPNHHFRHRVIGTTKPSVDG
ncbi:hypothetical protein PBI_MORRISSEY_44 [Gordonia phage Morrissey]|nr:hypothetical protein PBI_MORRISSEY_44 [Gordonia phage Morrissey]